MEYKEYIVANVNDLRSGEMKTVLIGTEKCLLINIKDELFAVSSNCPHYGAQLDEGILCGDMIICPWHHSYFNAKTGDLIEPPSLNALHKYAVRIDGQHIIVQVPEQLDISRVPAMSVSDPSTDKRIFVIVGAGAAGNAAAQTLREDGFPGRIIMITAENRLPYDRPNLSKEYLEGAAPDEWMPLRPTDFYTRYDIETILQTRVTSIDKNAQTILLESNEKIIFDRLLIATGGIPKKLEIKNSALANIFYLRSFDDSDAIIRASENSSSVVVIGSSFIGMECAYSLRKRKLSVTVISPESVPFEKIFGIEIGQLFQKLHEAKGIVFHLNSGVQEFQGQEIVTGVVLKDGQIIKADLVVVGIGIRPATGFLNGFDLMPDGSLRVDQFFRAAENIFAAGDIASFPSSLTGEVMRIEHWRIAEQQGRDAAHNMLGNVTPFAAVPFFWTHQAGLELRYTGSARSWDEIIVHGSIESKDFIVFYVKNNKVCAAAGNNRDQEMAAVEELLRREIMPSPEELRNNSVSLVDLARQ